MAKDNSPGGSPRPACDYSKSGARGNGSGKAIPGTQKANAVPSGAKKNHWIVLGI